MTVITKPLSQERKDEKEVVDLSEDPNKETKAPCDETVVVTSDSRSICVEIAGHSHVRQRTRPTKSPSRILFLTKICLLIPALFSIIMGFSIVMHGILKIGNPGRQMYKGYCRIPYPSTLFGELELSPMDWNIMNRHATVGHDHGSKPFGFAARLEGDGVRGEFTGNKKYYRLITGDFVNEPKQETQNEKAKKEKAIKLMMERLVQHFVAKGNRKSAHESDETMNKPPKLPTSFSDVKLPSAEDFQAAKHSKDTLYAKEKDLLDTNFELDFDIDIDSDREELQMPELSKGKYLHDFKMNKTAIIDQGKKRCFVFNLNRKDIASPRSLYEILHGMMKGSFGINLQQIRQDMAITYPAVNNFGEYGSVIKTACDGMKTYRLVPAALKRVSTEEGNVDITGQRVRKIGPSRTRRSTNTEVAQIENNYQEFAGKYIKYNIVNLNEIE